MTEAEKLAHDQAHARDLFGYPPVPRVLCPGCGHRAEPYIDAFCWLCSHTGRREMVLALTPTYTIRQFAEAHR